MRSRPLADIIASPTGIGRTALVQTRPVPTAEEFMRKSGHKLRSDLLGSTRGNLSVLSVSLIIIPVCDADYFDIKY